MPIMYYPQVGEIFICSYPKDFKEPEMIKTRPVVVVSPNFKHRGRLATIVPLSTTEPRNIMPYHIKITLTNPLPNPWNSNPFWAICDHSMTVGFDRLDLIRLGKDQYGKRKHYKAKLDKSIIHDIRIGIVRGIGLDLDKLTNS